MTQASNSDGKAWNNVCSVLMTEAGQPLEEILDEMEATLKFDPENHDLRLKVAELLMEDGQPRKSAQATGTD